MRVQGSGLRVDGWGLRVEAARVREHGGVAACRGIALLSLGRHKWSAVWKVVVCACRLRGRGSLYGRSVIQPRLAGSKVLDERRQPPLDSPIALVLNSEIRWIQAGARRTRCQLEQCSGWVAPAASPHGGPAGVEGGWDANHLFGSPISDFQKAIPIIRRTHAP